MLLGGNWRTKNVLICCEISFWIWPPVVILIVPPPASTQIIPLQLFFCPMAHLQMWYSKGQTKLVTAQWVKVDPVFVGNTHILRMETDAFLSFYVHWLHHYILFAAMWAAN